MLTGQSSKQVLSRRRFQFVGAIALGAFLPWFARSLTLTGSMTSPYGINGVIGNLAAITIAFWCRLSLEVYPGIRRAYVILPAALTGHGLVVAWFLFTRFPYDRVAILAGFASERGVALFCFRVGGRRRPATHRRGAIRRGRPAVRHHWR